MNKVLVDTEQKLVEIQLNGFVKTEEAVKIANEVKKTFLQFGPKQAVLLIDLVGFAPMSNDVLPIIRGMGRDIITFFRKTALIQEFSMSFGGGRKIIEPPPGYKLRGFPTREAAVAYLMEPDE